MRTKFKAQRKGAVLATVVTVSMMMVVIVAAAITLVAHTNTRTQDEYRKKQAYFAATSSLKAFIAQTTNITKDGGATYDEVEEAVTNLQKAAKDNVAVPVRFNKLSGAGGVGADISTDNPRWADVKCTIQVQPLGAATSNPTSLKVISRCTYLGQTQQVVAYLDLKPMAQETRVPNALEMIGTTGGHGTSGFNNIGVYGNTSTPCKDSHNENVVYDFRTNQTTFYGEVNILGSLVTGTTLMLRQNPYYVPGKEEAKDMTPGCVLSVSKTFHCKDNNPKIVSSLGKTPSDNDPPSYNYIYAGDAFVWAGTSGSSIGDSLDRMVDIYAGEVIFGNMSSVAGLADRCVNGAADAGAYKTKIFADANTGGGGNETSVYGNIYCYDNGNTSQFHGDIYINAKVHIYGDIYCEGNVYVNGDGANCDIHGNVYTKPGAINQLTASNFRATVADSSVMGTKKEMANWATSGERTQRPNPPEENVDQYYYYPEHLMCNTGTINGAEVSTIENTYAAFYDVDAVSGLGMDLKSKEEIRNDPNIDLLSDLYSNSYAPYEDNGVSITPKYVIKRSCIIDTCIQGDIIIDLDDAATNYDGNNNIVIIMTDAGSKMADTAGGPRNNLGTDRIFKDSQTKIAVVNKNHSGEDSNARFAYFVTESGVGKTNNEYATSGTVSTYDNSTFRACNVNGGSGGENCQLLVFDFLTYTHSGYTGDHSWSVNPTARRSGDWTRANESKVYDMPTGNIVFMGTEGSKITIGQQSFAQAAFFFPKGTVKWQNDCYNNSGNYIHIEPSYSEWDASIGATAKNATDIHCNIIGSVICQDFESSANDNYIVFQKPNKMSMISITKGVGENRRDESFKLRMYKSS